MAVEKYYGTGRRKSSVARVYLMPVPLTDVNRNMNLVQNPGY